MSELTFSNENIDVAVEKIIEYLGKNNIERKTLARIRIIAEEVLLKYQAKFGEDHTFTLQCEKRMGRLRLSLVTVGESVDPFGEMSEEELPLHSMMESLGIAPTWTYRGNKNVIDFILKVKHKIPTLVYVFVAIVAGIGLGFLSKIFLPETDVTIFCNDFLAPISNALMGFLSTLSGLMIFVSLVAGICGMGDVSTFNKIGKKMILRYFLVGLITAVTCAFGCLIFFPISAGQAAKFDLSTIWSLIVGIVPTNILDAFLNGNALQIIFMAMVTGIILLVLSSKAHELTNIIRQINTVVAETMEYVIKFLPVVVFISLFQNTAVGDLTELLGVYKIIVLLFIFCVIYVAATVGITCLTQKVSPIVIIRKMMPVFIIGISTASSSAALTTAIDTCEKGYGVEKRLVNVSVPLAQSLCKPCAILELGIGTLFMMQLHGNPITVSTYITLFLTAFILSMAAPPIPGGGAANYTLLFCQCGVPLSAVSIVMAINFITDRINTSSTLLMQQNVIIGLADSLDMIDKDKLRKDTKK